MRGSFRGKEMKGTEFSFYHTPLEIVKLDGLVHKTMVAQGLVSHLLTYMFK